LDAKHRLGDSNFYRSRVQRRKRSIAAGERIEIDETASAVRAVIQRNYSPKFDDVRSIVYD
jgi:hypothetical protein